MTATSRVPILKAPFPWMGGKGTVADLAWDRLGDVSNFIEPFAGSIATLLRRPAEHTGRIETISDINHYVVNFWRAVKADPDAVAEYADNPVFEADLHARHRWLELSIESAEHKDRIIADPDYFDARIAGWWAWGQSTWIGGGWCAQRSEVGGKLDTGHGDQLPRLEGSSGVNQRSRPDLHKANGVGVHQAGSQSKRPKLKNAGVNKYGDETLAFKGMSHQAKRARLAARNASGTGVNAPERITDPNRRPTLSNDIGVNAGRPQLGDAYDVGRGVNSNGAASTCADRREFLREWMNRLADRLRLVRACHGHWARICSSETTTTRLGLTGVFLDPPYPTHKADGTVSRDGSLYHGDDRTSLDKLRDEVLTWCRANGPNPQMRIAVCGYDSDGYAVLEDEGWFVEAWRAQGGYANRQVAAGKENVNRGRERIWFSPACDKEATLF